MKKHQIRIVGGIYKRTPINVIDSESLRPTSDRIRETLFNWLNYFWGLQFNDKHVLDLFAGSGALGLEAASRGAASVQMIDSSANAIKQIKVIVKKLNANNIKVQQSDAIKYLKSLKQTHYNLVMLDPPFTKDHLTAILPLLPNVLYSEALVYIETRLNYNLIMPDGFELLRQNMSGNVQYSLFRFAAMQKNSNNDNKFPINTESK